MSLTLNIFPASPTPGNVLPITIEKDRIVSKTESKYKVMRHVSSTATRGITLSFKGIKLSEKTILRNFIVQQDFGITPFLYKHPTEDLDIYAQSNQDALLELDDESVGNIGQGFKIPIQTPLHRVQLLLNKVGSPTGNLTLKIETDTAGEPSDAVLATSETVDITTLSTSLALIDFDFNTTARLDPFVQYHLVLEGDATYDGVFVTGVTTVQLGIDGSSPTYVNGSISTNTAGTWTADATKCGIFTLPDYIRCQTEESSFSDERFSGAESGMFNTSAALMEAL